MLSTFDNWIQIETMLEGFRLNERRIEIEWFASYRKGNGIFFLFIRMNSLSFCWNFFFVHIV